MEPNQLPHFVTSVEQKMICLWLPGLWNDTFSTWQIPHRKQETDYKRWIWRTCWFLSVCYLRIIWTANIIHSVGCGWVNDYEALDEWRGKTEVLCSSATLHTTTSLTGSGLNWNPELRIYGPAPNWLSQGKAQKKAQFKVFFDVIPRHLSGWPDQNNERTLAWTTRTCYRHRIRDPINNKRKCQPLGTIRGC
jgi:hypothetical protein